MTTTNLKGLPADTHGVRQAREQSEADEAVRRLQMQDNALDSDANSAGRKGAVRLTQLVDRATQTTQTTPHTEAGRSTSTVGATGAAPLNRTSAVDELAAHQQVFGTGETKLPPATAPRVEFTQRLKTGAESFAHNLNHAVDNIVLNARSAQTNVDARGVRALQSVGSTGQKDMTGLGPDELMSEFLKLNINDPNENVETHDKLYSVYTQLRQQGIEDAKKQSANAQQMKKDAEGYAKQAELIGTVVTVVSIALTVVTFGAAAPVAAGAVAATQAATVAATTAANQAITQAASQVAQTAVRQAVQQAVQQAGQGAAKAAIQESIKTIAQNAAKEAVKSVSQQAVQQVISEAAKHGVTMTVEQATTMIEQQISNQIIQQVGQQLATQAATTGATAATQTASSAATELATTSAAQAAQAGAQGAMNTARSFMTEMGNKVGTTMNRTLLMGSAVGQGVAAGANYKAATMAIDARKAQLGVDRARFRADQAQERIQDEGEVINTIMESKNQTIDAVMQMTNATWASRQQLMAASVAR